MSNYKSAGLVGIAGKVKSNLFICRVPRRRGPAALAANLLLFWALTISFPASGDNGKSLRIGSIKELPSYACGKFELNERGSGFARQSIFPATLGWITSGLLRERESEFELTLADLTYGKFANLVPGNLVQSTRVSLGSRGRENDYIAERPWYVAPRPDGGYLIVDLGNKETSYLVFVDRHDQVEGRPIPTQRRGFEDQRHGEMELGDVFRATHALGGAVVSGDFLISEEGKMAPTSGFAYMTTNGEIFFLEADFQEEPRHLADKYWARDFTYMATLDDGRVFLLMMEEKPWIGRVDLQNYEVERLPGFPDGLAVPPLAYSEPVGPAESIKWLSTLYGHVQGSAMPVGLYSYDDQLFLLVKSAKSLTNGHTTWTLVGLSAETGGPTGQTLVLPTNAAHLTLIVGSAFVAIIEKGEISPLEPEVPGDWSVLYRPVRSGIVFPATWLSRDSSLVVPASKRECWTVDATHPR